MTSSMHKSSPDHPGVGIRATRDADGAALRELRIEALRAHPIAFTADPDEAESQPMSHWIDRARAGAGHGTEAIIVAEEGARLLGMTGIYVPANRPKLAHTPTIWGVYVRPEARHRGLGQALVRAAVDWARGKGMKIVKLGATIADDGCARRCYEKCGFVPYGHEPMATCVNGKTYDEVLMALRLD